MDDKSKIITMRDAPVKKFIAPKLSKPMTTHDIYKPEADYPKDPKEPGGPLITTGNVDKIQEQAAMRARMEKARAAKMDKIKEELQAKKEKKVKKEKEPKKAKSEEKPKPEEKKAPESPPEPITEEAEAYAKAQAEKTDAAMKEVKPDPLKEAVDKANKQPSTRKSYTTQKKEEPKDA